MSSVTRDVPREETNSGYLDSRPSSSVAVAAPPDISCSPIISPDQEEVADQEKSKEGETERKTSTSTPLGIFSSQLSLFTVTFMYFIQKEKLLNFCHSNV